MKKILSAINAVKVAVASFFDKSYAYSKKNSHVAVMVTENLKKAVESPLASFIVDIIPGNVDNQIHYKLQKVVGPIATQMALAHGFIQASETNSNAVAAIIESLKEYSKEGRVEFWRQFAANINQALSDGKLSIIEAWRLSQEAYAEFKKNK
jgi:hypothetical protein